MRNYGEIIAVNLKALMRDLGLKQVEFAKQAGVDQPVMSRALKGLMGNAKLSTLEALVAPFKKDVLWLLTDHESEAVRIPEPVLRSARAAAESAATAVVRKARLSSPADPLVPGDTVAGDLELRALVASLRGRPDAIAFASRMLAGFNSGQKPKKRPASKVG